MKQYLNINIEFDQNIVDRTIENAIVNKEPGYVCSVNSNNFVMGNKSKNHMRSLNSSLVNICDGSMIALILSRIYGKKYVPYVGADLFEKYLRHYDYSYLFLGSTKEIMYHLEINIREIYPHIKHAYFKTLPFKAVEEFDYKDIGTYINSIGVDIIWVSLGAPKQEQFMYNLKPFLKRGVMFGFGAILGFNSGIKKYKRAPALLRSIKMEWLFRLFKEPFRISKRFLPQLPILIKLVFREKKNHHQ